jgi:hypothetical protein
MELISVFLRCPNISKFEIFITHGNKMILLRILERVLSLHFIPSIPLSYHAFQRQYF